MFTTVSTIVKDNLPHRIEGDRWVFCEVPKDVLACENASMDKTKWSNWRLANFDYLKDHLSDISNDAIVIDLGTGPARFRDLTNRFNNYIGVDFYPFELVSVVTDLTKPLPFKDNCCDVILITNVLEHLPTPHSFIEECYRVLKTGGILIGTVPFLCKIHQSPYDFLRYTNFMLEYLFKTYGFKKFFVEPLGTSYDLYLTISRRFFARATHMTQGYWHLFLVNVERKIIFFSLRLLKPVLSKVKSTPKLTEGYGFIAYK